MSPMTRRILGWALGVVFAVVAPSPAGATGAWTTMLGPLSYSDLFADGDTVWCASGEAGLWRYVVSQARLESITREPGGLASNELSSLTYDRSRRLWIGTLGAGVSVLSADRTRWSRLNIFDGLPSDTVETVEAEGDTVWIGTARGIALWNGQEISGALPDGVNPSPFANNVITGIVALGDTLWVSTQGGVYRALKSQDLETWTRHDAGLVSPQVDALASDGVDLIALSGFATMRWRRSTARWDTLQGVGAARGLWDDHGRITTAAGRGIFRWTGTRWDSLSASLVSLGGPTNFAATQAADGRGYAANRTGVYRQPDGGGPWPSLKPDTPPGNAILNLILEGPKVYVTTFSDGIGRWDGTRWRSWLPTGSVDRADTTFRRALYTFAALVDTAGRKWFGSWAPLEEILPCEPDTGAIEMMTDDTEPAQFVHHVIEDGLHPARHSFAWAAALDSSGGHWFGFDSPCQEDPDFEAIGVDYYDPSGVYRANWSPENTPTLSAGRVHALTVDRNGRIWLGLSPGGLTRTFAPVNPQSPATPTFLPVAGTELLDVQGMVARDTSLWVLTTSELVRYTLSGVRRESYTVPAGPAATALHPLDVGRDGTVWMGTANGVRMIRPNRTTQDFTAANSPLADDEVRAIRVDPVTNVVWFGTARGLNRYDPGYVPPAITPEHLTIGVFPNPARLTNLGPGIHLAGNGERYHVRIYDLHGRLVRDLGMVSNGRVLWDGRHAGGSLVDPGIYFVRAETQGRQAVARIALVR